MPEGGLKQLMLNNTRQLKLDEVVNAAGNKFDNLQKQISTSFIADAIRCAYPAAVDGIFNSNADIEYPCMPVVDILPHGRTEHVTLGPILDSEASINGNYRVMENIFLDQLQYNRETAFNDRLFLIYGDQKTAKLIRSCKEERVEAECAYDSHKWVLPIPGLWHVRLNFLYMVMRTFYGGEEAAQQFSALYTHINHLGRRNIPREKAPFHYMEELILHSFDARVVALFLLHIRDKCNIEADGEAEQYVQNLSPQQFLEHVEDIRIAAFSRDVCRDANQRTSDSEPPANGRQPAATSSSADTSSSTTDNQVPQSGDTEFFNHIRFLQVIDTYKLLKYAIKHADIGLLKRVIPRLCLYFAGSSSKNYAYDMLLLWRLVGTSACDPVLQRAILANSLVNLRGRPDSFFETDRLNELLNLQLKELLWTRGNSTFGTDELFKWSVLTISYTGALRDIFECAFGERTNSEHTTKSPALDIRYLADQIRKDSIMRYTRRSADFEAPSLLQRGYEKLAKDGVNTFNAFLLTAAGLPFDPLTCSFGDADENIEVLGEAAEYIHMVCCPNVTPIPLLMCIIVGV